MPPLYPNEEDDPNVSDNTPPIRRRALSGAQGNNNTGQLRPRADGGEAAAISTQRPLPGPAQASQQRQSRVEGANFTDSRLHPRGSQPRPLRFENFLAGCPPPTMDENAETGFDFDNWPPPERIDWLLNVIGSSRMTSSQQDADRTWPTNADVRHMLREGGSELQRRQLERQFLEGQFSSTASANQQATDRPGSSVQPSPEVIANLYTNSINELQQRRQALVTADAGAIANLYTSSINELQQHRQARVTGAANETRNLEQRQAPAPRRCDAIHERTHGDPFPALNNMRNRRQLEQHPRAPQSTPFHGTFPPYRVVPGHTPRGINSSQPQVPHQPQGQYGSASAGYPGATHPASFPTGAYPAARRNGTYGNRDPASNQYITRGLYGNGENFHRARTNGSDPCHTAHGNPTTNAHQDTRNSAQPNGTLNGNGSNDARRISSRTTSNSRTGSGCIDCDCSGCPDCRLITSENGLGVTRDMTPLNSADLRHIRRIRLRTEDRMIRHEPLKDCDCGLGALPGHAENCGTMQQSCGSHAPTIRIDPSSSRSQLPSNSQGQIDPEHLSPSSWVSTRHDLGSPHLPHLEPSTASSVATAPRTPPDTIHPSQPQFPSEPVRRNGSYAGTSDAAASQPSSLEDVHAVLADQDNKNVPPAHLDVARVLPL